MRKVLLAASAVAVTVGMAAGAQAADPSNADVNFVNIAVNAVPYNLGPAIDGSINVTAIGGDVGHQGWHRDRDLDPSSTFAAGAVNQTELNIGRNAASGDFVMDGTTISHVDSFEVDEITHVDAQARVRAEEGGFFGGELYAGGELHYFDVDDVDFWSSTRVSNLDLSGNLAYEGVPATNVVNLALNFESIDGSANYTAVGFMSEVGNIGAISTSAIGALNVTTATIGVPGGISDLGSAGASDL